jgi:hypothetical protein
MTIPQPASQSWRMRTDEVTEASFQVALLRIVTYLLTLPFAFPTQAIDNGYIVLDAERNRTGIVRLEVWDRDQRRAINEEIARYVQRNASYTGRLISNCY